MYVHPKNSKHLQSHSRAIMALDHSRLGLENKLLPTNLRVCKPTFYTFYTSHLRWNSNFLSYRPRTEYGISQFFNVQDDQSWAFSETVQKISKITHTASRFSFLVRAVSMWSSVWMNFNGDTLQHNNEYWRIYYHYFLLFNGSSYNDL